MKSAWRAYTRNKPEHKEFKEKQRKVKDIIKKKGKIIDQSREKLAKNYNKINIFLRSNEEDEKTKIGT